MLFVLTAAAAPVTAGLQAQIHPEGLAFLSEHVDDMVLELGPYDLETELSCYTLDVDNLNLDLTFEDLELAASPAGLTVDLSLSARGTYIDIAGSSGWIDTCIDFARLLELVDLSDARLVGTLEADVVDGALALSFAEPPVVTGTMTTDADWFPDDLVWSYLEGVVLDTAATQLEAQLPPLVQQFTTDAFLIDPLGTGPIALSLADADADERGLYAAASVDLGGSGSDAAPLSLPGRDGAHLAIGITEDLATSALVYSWEQGLIDPTTAENQALVEGLIDGLGLGADVDVQLSLAQTPEVSIDASGTRLSLTGVDLQVGTPDAPLAHLIADVAASLDVDVQGGSLLLSAHDFVIDVERLEADGLLARDDADADVAAFLEGWVASAASSWVQQIPVYRNQIGALGYVLQVTDVVPQPEGLVVWARIHHDDDSSIDREAPDTRVDASGLDTTLTATFGADEDEVTYSWRLDDGGWSSWSTEPHIEAAVTPGIHTLEVRARDAWHNIDPTPATASLDFSAPAPAPKPTGCSSVLGTPLWLGVLGLFGLRRR